MKFANVRMPLEELEALMESDYKPAENWITREIYEDSDEIQDLEARLGIARQLVKDLGKELFELKHPKK